MPRLKLKPPRLSHRTKETASTILEVTVRCLEASKDVITAVAPVPGLSVALDVTIALMKRIQDAESNCGALVSLCDETTSLADTLRRLAKTIEAGLAEYPVNSPEKAQAAAKVFGSRKLVERVETLESELRTIFDAAHTLNKRTTFGRLLHKTADATAVTNMKERITAAHRRFQFEGGVWTEAIVSDILSEVKNITSALRAAEEERVLSSIPRVDEAHYLSAANTMKARLQEGTREQVFARLEEWERGQFVEGSAPPVLVLVGEAGTGKSTIASEYSRRLEARKHYGASYFFTRGLQDLNSPWKVFSTIASQLARSQPALRIPIVDAAREHLKTVSLQQLEHEFDDLLRKPLSTLSSSHPPIFVILDALNECTEEGPELVPSLLRLLLSAAVQPGSPLRIFFTSRPEPHYIHKVFTTSDMQPHVSMISIQEFRSSIDHDIERFIRVKLDESHTSNRWLEVDPTIVRSLVVKSDGLFIYARTAIDFILGDVDDLLSMQERYHLLMTDEGSSAGLDPIDTLYSTVLQSVFPPRERYAKMQDRLKRVLGYLVAVLEPEGISPRTLEKLTNMPAVESVPILNKLRSVIFFQRSNPNSRFRIMHASFREFLTDPSRTAKGFHVSGEQAHGLLADDCMRIMRSFLNDEFRHFTQAALLSHLLKRTFPEVEEPHFEYVAMHIEQHRERRPASDHQKLGNRPIDDDDILAAVSIFRCLRSGSDQTASCVNNVLTSTQATVPRAVSMVPGLGVAFTISGEIVKTLQATGVSNPWLSRELMSLCLVMAALTNTLEEVSKAVEAEMDAGCLERTEAQEKDSRFTNLPERLGKLTRELQASSAEARNLQSRTPYYGSPRGLSELSNFSRMTKRIVNAHRNFQVEGCVIIEETLREIQSHGSFEQ